ncbi:hypothetical protein, partial [Acidithiobacillus thiooxidans]|uniref:hypothetical protein n=1 Tax=Acidithiobacillus thiooxidans TaxID=930 RepID=UPI001C065B16
ALNRLNDAAEYCGRSLEAQAEKWLSHPLPPARRLAAMLILESALRRAENESCCIAPDGCGWIAFLPGWALGEGVVPGL